MNKELEETALIGLSAILNAIDTLSPIELQHENKTTLKLILFNEIDKETAEERLEEFCSDPVGLSLRYGLQRLGRLASKSLTLEEMHGVLEAAAGTRPRLTDIVDKWWDGICCKCGNVWAS